VGTGAIPAINRAASTLQTSHMHHKIRFKTSYNSFVQDRRREILSRSPRPRNLTFKWLLISSSAMGNLLLHGESRRQLESPDLFTIAL
jgi:hypothetical protein